VSPAAGDDDFGLAVVAAAFAVLLRIGDGEHTATYGCATPITLLQPLGHRDVAASMNVERHNHDKRQ
jgi:hypothetical protein